MLRQFDQVSRQLYATVSESSIGHDRANKLTYADHQNPYRQCLLAFVSAFTISTSESTHSGNKRIPIVVSQSPRYLQKLPSCHSCKYQLP